MANVRQGPYERVPLREKSSPAGRLSYKPGGALRAGPQTPPDAPEAYGAGAVITRAKQLPAKVATQTA